MEVKAKLTLEEFFALPEGDITYELVDGEAKPKLLPKRFHSRLTVTLFLLLRQWNQDWGEVGIEWAIRLKRKGQDWVPIPDLLYISDTRLSRDRILDEPCPVPPELAIEIISPDQSFGEISGKAIDYLNAGVSRICIGEHLNLAKRPNPPAPFPTREGGARRINSPVRPN